FTDWAVLAAPRFLGRTALAQALNRFALEGAWGISPHLIPHHSLHSLSGTISQALTIHGPNYGIGGGPDAASKALLTAAALLTADRLPRLWVGLTGYDPAPLRPLAATGNLAAATPPTQCNAVALALVSADRATDLSLHIAPSVNHLSNGRAAAAKNLPRFRVETLQAALREPLPD